MSGAHSRRRCQPATSCSCTAISRQKTAFVKGPAEGLGVERERGEQPDVHDHAEYRGGRLTLFHVDLYRLNDPREIDDLGLDEIAEDGVLAIEWAEKLTGDARLKPSRYEGDARLEPSRNEGNARLEPSRYTHAVSVRIEHGDADTRHPRIQLPDAPITQTPDSL
jgi:hypothetical protein